MVRYFEQKVAGSANRKAIDVKIEVIAGKAVIAQGSGICPGMSGGTCRVGRQPPATDQLINSSRFQFASIWLNRASSALQCGFARIGSLVLASSLSQ